MNQYFRGVVLICILITVAFCSGCTTSNRPVGNPLDALSMNENEDEFVTLAKNNLIIMQAGADNFEQLFKVYNIGTLSADANSQKFMQQFRLEYQGIDNLIGASYGPGIAGQMGPYNPALAKELYRFSLKSEDLLNWRGNFVALLFGEGRSGDTGYLFDMQESGYNLIAAYDRGDYTAATKYAGDFRTDLNAYKSAVVRYAGDLQKIRP